MNRTINNPFKDVNNNLFASVTLPGNQMGNVLSFIIKIDDRILSSRSVSEDYIMSNQVAFSTSPYKASCKSFRRNVIKNGGSLL